MDQKNLVVYHRLIAAILLLTLLGCATLFFIVGNGDTRAFAAIAFVPAVVFVALLRLQADVQQQSFASNVRRIVGILIIGYATEVVEAFVCPALGVFGDGIGSAFGGALVCGGGLLFGYLITFVAAVV